MSAPSPPKDPEGAGVVLGIHSVVYEETQRNGGSAALIDGHAWISVTRDGHTQHYGLWPDNHRRVEDNGRASDIRQGLEAGVTPKASRYYALTGEQARTLNEKLKENVTWSYTNTCASWASATVKAVTGQRVNAGELWGLTDTPRELIDSIDELERKQPTTPASPVKAGELRMESSSFGALTHPAHPEHALYRQVSTRVAQIDASLGRMSDGNSHRLAAGVTLLAAEQGMHRVDRLELSAGRNGLPDGERVILWQGVVGERDYKLGSGRTDELLALSEQDIANRLAAARVAEDHMRSGQINEVAQERQAPMARA